MSKDKTIHLLKTDGSNACGTDSPRNSADINIATCKKCLIEHAATSGSMVSILSVDAWRYDRGWTWNQWFKLGEVGVGICDIGTRDLLAWLRREGYLGSGSIGTVAVEDDQYNVVIVDRVNRMPILAIAYGEAQDVE